MVNEKEKKIIEKNFTEIDDSRRIATTKDGDCFAVTTSPRMRPLINKKSDSYVAEKDKRKIKLLGSYNGHQSGNIYDKQGLSPSLCCTDYKAPVKIITKEESCIEKIWASTQKRGARKGVDYAPTLTEAMGKGGGHVPMLKLRETTKKGYKEAHEGDGVLTNRGNRKIAKGIVREQHCGNLMTTPDWGTVTSDYRIRKLTPRECERLQAFSPSTQEVELWLSDQVRKNVQSVAERWHKNLKLVGNAEKDKLLKNVSFVEKSSLQKNPQTKKLVPENVLINYEAKQIQGLCLKKSESSAKIVEKRNMFHHQVLTDNFVHLIVGMSTIVERIIRSGKEELLRNEQWQIHQENGKIVVNLFGNEIMPLANSVEDDMTTMNQLMKFITSDLSNIKTQDMMLITLYCCVIGVIIGYIPVRIDLSCLERINLEITTDWTEYGKDGEEISNTQRYKCCGNAVTTTVVTFMINQMFDGLDEES